MVRKQFSREFKLAVLQELESGKTTAEVCRLHDLKKDVVYRWKHEYHTNPELAFAGHSNVSSLEAKNAELEQTIGQLYAENRLLKKALQTLERLKQKTK